LEVLKGEGSRGYLIHIKNYKFHQDLAPDPTCPSEL
jgi:hypothetical protein